LIKSVPGEKRFVNTIRAGGWRGANLPKPFAGVSSWKKYDFAALLLA